MKEPEGICKVQTWAYGDKVARGGCGSAMVYKGVTIHKGIKVFMCPNCDM